MEWDQAREWRWGGNPLNARVPKKWTSDCLSIWPSDKKAADSVCAMFISCHCYPFNFKFSTSVLVNSICQIFYQCPCHLNGGVEAATTLVGALLSLLLRFLFFFLFIIIIPSTTFSSFSYLSLWFSLLSPALCTSTGRFWAKLVLLFSPSWTLVVYSWVFFLKFFWRSISYSILVRIFSSLFSLPALSLFDIVQWHSLRKGQLYDRV